VADYSRLIIFKRPPDYPLWACGCMRKPALHLTNPKALEGNPWRECWTCEQARSARRFQAFSVGLVAFLLTIFACFAAFGGLHP
jgi:hypothetical protein